jgi:hypothetical protein
MSSKRSQQDRELLHEYLVTVFTPQKESAYVRPSITDALADAIPALGNLLGRRKAVVAGTTVADSGTENAKREALFQQQRLLTLSATYLESAPWISYLTASKHSRFMECFGLTTSAFADFGDKKLVDETGRLADELEVKSSALMDSETRDVLRELIKFSERKDLVSSAISILNEITSSPHRALIHTKLTTGKVEIAQKYPTRKTLPDGSGYMTMGMFCVFGCVIVGTIAATAETGNPLRGGFFAVAVALGTAPIFFFTFGARQGADFAAEKARYDRAVSSEKERVQQILDIVNRLAEMFRSTVEPLLRWLQIPINFPDFEGMLAELLEYQTWGLEAESRYTKT